MRGAGTPSALILAAGDGRRMSGDHALLRIGQRTLIEEHIEALRRAGIEEIAVVRREVTPLMPRGAGAVRVVLQQQEDAPTFDSLVLGLFALPRGPVLVLSADHDLLGDDTLAMLVESASRNETTHAIVPCFDGRSGHPVVLFPEAVEAIVRDAVNREGVHRLDRLLARWTRGVRSIDVPDDAVVRDFEVPQVLSGRR